jgi:hypothetical protein
LSHAIHRGTQTWLSAAALTTQLFAIKIFISTIERAQSTAARPGLKVRFFRIEAREANRDHFEQNVGGVLGWCPLQRGPALGIAMAGLGFGIILVPQPARFSSRLTAGATPTLALASFQLLAFAF